MSTKTLCCKRFPVPKAHLVSYPTNSNGRNNHCFFEYSSSPSPRLEYYYEANSTTGESLSFFFSFSLIKLS